MIITTSVKLDNDLDCTATDGLIVNGATNITIDFNTYSIVCKEREPGTGYLKSCQGLGGSVEAGPVGIKLSKTGNNRNIIIKGPGKIIGFNVGISLGHGANITVENLTITGPKAPSVTLNNNNRPDSRGIDIGGVGCAKGPMPTEPEGATIIKNDISNHAKGIVIFSSCVNVGFNKIHENNTDKVPFPGGQGIQVNGSHNINIFNNDGLWCMKVNQG